MMCEIPGVRAIGPKNASRVQPMTRLFDWNAGVSARDINW
jgi:hypothetical protein